MPDRQPIFDPYKAKFEADSGAKVKALASNAYFCCESRQLCHRASLPVIQPGRQPATSQSTAQAINQRAGPAHSGHSVCQQASQSTRPPYTKHHPITPMGLAQPMLPARRGSNRPNQTNSPNHAPTRPPNAIADVARPTRSNANKSTSYCRRQQRGSQTTKSLPRCQNGELLNVSRNSLSTLTTYLRRRAWRPLPCERWALRVIRPKG